MFHVTPIPAFDDNYIWALQQPGSTQVAVVDPGDAAPVQAWIAQHGFELSAILITHHHGDHTGGVAELATTGIPVYGSHHSSFNGITHPLQQGDRLELFGQTLHIQEVPGHTLDHISYYLSTGDGQLFCGDTLFLAGCGRLFEGSASQMLDAMLYFRNLPDSTEVYCTHEYSLANLAFASAVEPDNHAIQACLQKCQRLRNLNQPTLPSNIATELQINPFMRSNQPDVIAAAARFNGTKGDEIAIFTAIREWKNQF
ncbi:MAG: hydroxyacylglutathione hydrolase [Marinobacterium sp.]|nr:hydroxyacylglutathione hydrolase [Marinobacterium sp.]